MKYAELENKESEKRGNKKTRLDLMTRTHDKTLQLDKGTKGIK